MAEIKLPTKTVTFFESANSFKIFTYYDAGGACVNYILSFIILSENTPEGLEGDLLVSIDNSNPSTDVWLQDGDLYIYDPLAPDYYFNLDGDVIFECTE